MNGFLPEYTRLSFNHSVADIYDGESRTPITSDNILHEYDPYNKQAYNCIRISDKHSSTVRSSMAIIKDDRKHHYSIQANINQHAHLYAYGVKKLFREVIGGGETGIKSVFFQTRVYLPPVRNGIWGGYINIGCPYLKEVSTTRVYGSNTVNVTLSENSRIIGNMPLNRLRLPHNNFYDFHVEFPEVYCKIEKDRHVSYHDWESEFLEHFVAITFLYREV